MQRLNNPRQAPILIVDDDPSMRAALTATLQAQDYRVVCVSSAEEALTLCKNRSKKQPFSAILSDIKMPKLSGIDFFEQIRGKWQTTPFIFMSAFGSVEGAVDAMKLGAADYLVKPFSEETLVKALNKVLQGEAQKQPTRNTQDKNIVTKDPALLAMLKMAEVVAASNATVLIEAESGTGKELLARYLHAHSPRAHRAFVAINCAAVPEALLESELFGYEKGAFTGATEKKPGRFELAQGGTLLLDEVSEMQFALQAKLLRVLQEREVDILGGKKSIPIDIRVIATTNKPLFEEVKAGNFREDLYYRLNVFPLKIPPLRQRLSDLPNLIDHFVQQSAKRNGIHLSRAPHISKEALNVLSTRSWPGNVRELENIVERALLLSYGQMIQQEHLLLPDNPVETEGIPQNAPVTVWEAERKLILETLTLVSANRTHAARRLGISIRTLRNKLREYHQLDPHCEEAQVSH